MERRWLHIITTLYVLVGSTAVLSARFSSSAAFERPIHLSILTLLVSGAVLLVVARRARADLPSAIQLVPPSAVQAPFRTVPSAAPLAAAKSLLHSLRRLRIGSASLTLLIACITCRTIVFRRIIRSIHCSRDGLHAFLPFLLALAETKGRPAASSGRHGYFPELGRTSLGPSTRYIVLAATWGWSATQMYLSPSGAVGSICPPGWRWEPFVPFAQVFVVLLDAAAIDYTSRLWQRHQAVGPCSALLSSAFLSSSAVLTLLSILFFTLHDSDIAWAFRIHDVRVRHLALDTLLASSALLSSVFLLSSVRPSTIAVLFSATGLSAELCLRLVNSAATLASLGSWAVGILGLASVAALLHFDKETLTATCFRGESPHRALMTLYWGLLAVLVTLYVAAVPRPYSIEPSHHAIPSLAEAHGRMSETWVATARQSTTFDEAVAEYKRRYRIPPPPNFDKWYEFAVSWNSTIIDSFDQVSSDLRPFWGVVPSVIRARTAHLVESPSLRIGGLRIRKGEIKLSPHTPGTHRWMMDANAAMMKPFARWLPDMDLAFNLDDECRVALPFTDSRLLHVAARQSQARLAELDTAKLTGFAKAEDAAVRWPSKYFEPDSAPGVAAKSPHFRDNTRRQLFYDVVAPACPPDSRARQSVWWNRKALCTACLQRHTLSDPGMHVVSDWVASGDVCHQPDLAYLHGFITSPAPMLGTNRLFPIFSQARTAGFSDVLVPSPWSFVDKTVYEPAEDVPWEQKHNTLFWRGSPSDGFAINGGWEGFPRARFVHAAQRVAADFDTPGWVAHEHETGQCSDGVCGRPFGVNVSFVGEFRKCHEPDCIAEADTFYRYGGGSRPKSGHHVEGGRDASFLPPPVPFSDHWAFRHLIDFDGAGFSGRFVPFLLSRSLVYRVALFRTWYEERVHAWRHYVPVDVRLGKGLWGIVNFFAGKHGEGLGRRIAEDGRDWAAQVLRKEDMQIYMFRLLLEWGRVVDDQREEIGWSY